MCAMEYRDGNKVKIVLPKYATNYNLCPIKTEQEANKHGLTFEYKKPEPGEIVDYLIFWGLQSYIPNYGLKYGVMETGFFNEGAFIDTVSNYQFSSLNTKMAYDLIDNFDLKGRPTAKDIISNFSPHQQSKYNATFSEKNKPTEWEGVVLALQNPKDRAVLSATTTARYYEFVEECCKYYGDKLFVKMHPWNSNEVYDSLADIAKKYNCQYGKVPISIIDKCEFVIAYNSTFAIDCLLRDVPYVQYGMGTFYNAYGIIYSEQTLPNSITKKEDGQKLCNFLIHKYCYRKDMRPEKFVRMVEHFSKSHKMFPMTDEFSYASGV